MNFSFMSSPEPQERTGISMSTSEKKAYQQGEKEAKEAGFLDNLFHGGYPGKSGRSFRIDSGHLSRSEATLDFFGILPILQVVSSFCFFLMEPPFNWIRWAL
jgi:hypothetical protein